jgi:putative FmdB family regulatory protein
MPLYEYFCDNCNTKFEMRRAMSESDAATACPECQSEKVERQISLVFAMTGGEQSSSAPTGCGCGGACGCASRA